MTKPFIPRSYSVELEHIITRDMSGKGIRDKSLITCPYDIRKGLYERGRNDVAILDYQGKRSRVDVCTGHVSFGNPRGIRTTPAVLEKLGIMGLEEKKAYNIPLKVRNVA